MEYAQALGKRSCEQSNDDRERIAYAFRAAVARTPSDDEVGILVRVLDKTRKDSDEKLAWTLVARAILNLDETITRE